MKTVLSLVGARPQFIKLAPVSVVLRRKFRELVLHTGQHYDEEMSRVFFQRLELPRPDYNLGVGSGSHGRMTGRMLAGIEEILEQERPDLVVVFGDTNSTLAGALAAAKMHIPVAHVEAGLRSFNRHMPEELNRVLTDHLADLLFCPTPHAVELLAREGITGNVSLTGDVMYDALLHFRPLAQERSTILADLGLEGREYNLLTIHRAENTDAPHRLEEILVGLQATDLPLVFPVHPRTRKLLASPKLKSLLAEIPGLHLCPPVDFLDMVQLEIQAGRIITDSGGVQKEAYCLRKPCITLRSETEWIETVENGYNLLTGADSRRIARALQSFFPGHRVPDLYGNGRAAELIGDLIEKFLS